MGNESGLLPSLTHLVLVSFPGQGHINPLLRLGKRLASKGLLVTFSTTESMGKQMQKANKLTDQPIPVGDGFVRFEFFSDGWEDDDPRRFELDCYMQQLELAGRDALPRMVAKYAPVACVINNPFIPWVCDVAAELEIPCATLWVQSCAVFSTYYYYLHGSVPFPSEKEPHLDVQLPAMPLLKHDEIPSFMHPSTPYGFLKDAILGQFKCLDKPFCVLMDSFRELEPEVFDHVSNLCHVRPVGPLFKAANAALRGDIMESADECLEWLDGKPPSSVVYISFGTVVYISQEQVDEIAGGVLSSGKPFLWVMKPPHASLGRKPHKLPEGFLEKVGEKGKVVSWCPQEQVLAHPSVACFLTHCGWNSSVEALASGVPVMAFPHWGDQVTNAKFLVEEFKVGLRLSRGDADKKLVTAEEVAKVLEEMTTGPNASEMKQNALRWKQAADAALSPGGSSDTNIQAFVEEVRQRGLAAPAATKPKPEPL